MAQLLHTATVPPGHFPFGESWYNAANDKLMFTSHERDAESGNDYAMACSYVSRLARFSSLDPLTGTIGNPQSLNRYSYVQSDPINPEDPHGLASCKRDDTCDNKFTRYDHFNDAIGSSGCYVNGFASSCGLAYYFLDNGLGVQCPNNNCYQGVNAFQCIGSACGYFSQEYAATHRNEWNGMLFDNAQWAVFISDRVEAIREAITDAISMASNSPDGSNWMAIYNSLVYTVTKGGNADFSWDAVASGVTLESIGLDPAQFQLATGGCQWSCRDGSMPSLHYHNYMFHLDTASPLWGFGLGFFIHGVADVGFGSMNYGFPMLHP